MWEDPMCSVAGRKVNSCASELLRSFTMSSFSGDISCCVLLFFDTTGGIIAGCGHGAKHGRKNGPGICIQGWLNHYLQTFH